MQIELEAQEVILGRIRAHKILLIRRMVIGLLVVFFLFSNTFLLFRTGLFGSIIFLITLTGVLLYLFQAYTSWNHTMLLVTSKRVIDIYQPTLFKRQVAELAFDTVQVAKVLEEKTWLDKVSGAGTIRVYGKQEGDFDLEMHHVPKPHAVVDLINEAHTVYNKHTT